MFKSLVTLFCFVCSSASIAQPQRIDLSKTREDNTSRSPSSKMNFQLERSIAIARANKVDLRSVFIVAIMKTTPEINSASELQAIFGDQKVEVRGLIKSKDGNIITFSSTLQGALNATQSRQVYSVQMAHTTAP